tara:strand:- start:258 stop:827 length:570 start_codon:yes stop_codon:yes gene_type:complete
LHAELGYFTNKKSNNISIWAIIDTPENSTNINKSILFNYLTPFNIEVSLNKINNELYSKNKLSITWYLFDSYGFSYSKYSTIGNSKDKSISLMYFNDNNLVFTITNRNILNEILITSYVSNQNNTLLHNENRKYFSITKYFNSIDPITFGISILAEFTNFKNPIGYITNYNGNYKSKQYSYLFMIGLSL